MLQKLCEKLGLTNKKWYAPTYKTLRILLYTSLALFPLYSMMILEYMNSRGSLDDALIWRRTFPMSAFFGFIVVASIFIVLLILCRKAVIACGILGTVAVLAGYINYVKMAVNGDNFFPRDMAMAGNIGELVTFTSTSVPRDFWLGGVVLMVLWLIALGMFNIEVPVTWKIRIPVGIALALVLVLPMTNTRRAERVLNRFNMSFFDAAMQSSNYHANGFVGAFTINVLSMNVERPGDYSRETIYALLEGFPNTPATKEYFDVIVVLSESFFDVRILPGVEFSENPLPNFDAITARPNAYSGLVYTTAINGGTIRPEFDILTGLTTDFLPGGAIPYEFLRGPMATYVSNYQDAGYRTIALHPFLERFYGRHIAYPQLGFDAFLGYETLQPRFDFESNHAFVTDISFWGAMEHYLDAALEDDTPIFMFAITMQNHQPFPMLEPEDIRIQVASGDLMPNVLSAVTSFTQGLNDADTMLGMLVDYIDNRERPTVMLFFGDHLPNLGGHLAAFMQSGLIPPDNHREPEVAALIYSTPFIIYSNRELNPLLQNTDNHVSTYYLLSILAYKTGFHRTPYMNLLLDYFHQIPFHNVRLHRPETEISRSLERTKRLMTYDRLVGRGYSE